MKNWSNTIEKFDKNSDQYVIWRLEQMINFGLDNQKISRPILKKYLSCLYIDERKRKYLKYLLLSK